MQARWFGLFRVRSPLLAESLLFSLPPGTEMVHFPGLSSPPYGFRRRYSGINLSGFPHSDILGSKPVCGSPKLFAAYHVLHRLLAPRHSPYALSSLTIETLKLTPEAPLKGCATATAPLHTALCESTGLGGRGGSSRVSPYGRRQDLCGRKKLPFAGYSVVKESLKRLAASLGLSASWRPHVCGSLRLQNF